MAIRKGIVLQQPLTQAGQNDLFSETACWFVSHSFFLCVLVFKFGPQVHCMVILSHHEQQTALKIVALVALVSLVSLVTGISHISFTCGREARAEASPACTFIYDAACGSLR